MATMIDLRFGIPDIDLGCTSGMRINPTSFAGHDLIVLFYPLDSADAAQEISAYRRHGAELVKRDAWLLTFAEQCGEVSVDGPGRLLTIPDPDRHAWVAFRDLTPHPEELERSSGATFLFTRGGGLHCFWHGAGHVDDVLAELRIHSSLHSHEVHD